MLLPLCAFPQKKLIFELSGGVGSGWWNYDKGNDSTGHLGWDHSSTRGFVNAEADLIFKIKRWNIGAGAKLNFFFDDLMLAGDHSLSNYDKYPISEKTVFFTQFYLLSEYDLVNRQKFLFSPHLKVGSFLIETLHPREEEFGFRILFEAGISNQIALAENLWLVLRPYCQAMTIWGNEKAREDERHQIFNFSFNAGLRYAFF